MPNVSPRRVPTLEELQTYCSDNVDVLESGCFEWIGPVDVREYDGAAIPTMELRYYAGKEARKYCYEAKHGLGSSVGLVVTFDPDSSCVVACVNPDHMRVETAEQRLLRRRTEKAEARAAEKATPTVWDKPIPDGRNRWTTPRAKLEKVLYNKPYGWQDIQARMIAKHGPLPKVVVHVDPPVKSNDDGAGAYGYDEQDRPYDADGNPY